MENKQDVRDNLSQIYDLEQRLEVIASELQTLKNEQKELMSVRKRLMTLTFKVLEIGQPITGSRQLTIYNQGLE